MSYMHTPPHPGEILREVITDAGWTCNETAKCLGCTPSTLSRILNGHAGISPRLALALERLGWSNAKYWIRMQSGYDLEMARRRDATLDRARG